jgi:hypothetical protein
MTPLGASVSRGNYAAVKTLLEHSSQVDCDQTGGYYLLRNAIYNNLSGKFLRTHVGQLFNFLKL